MRLDRAACAAHPSTGGRIRLFEQGWERRGTGERGDDVDRTSSSRSTRTPNSAKAPIWDDRRACLFWVDIMRGLVHRLDPATGVDRAFDVGPAGRRGRRSTADDDLVLAVRDGFARLDLDTGAVRVDRARSSDDRPDLRMNDGSCDAAGRFWAGTMALDERPGAGALYRLDPDGRVAHDARPASPSPTASTGATTAA